MCDGPGHRVPRCDDDSDKTRADSSVGVRSLPEETAFLCGSSTYWGSSGLFYVLIRFITDHVLSSGPSVCVGFEVADPRARPSHTGSDADAVRRC